MSRGFKAERKFEIQEQNQSSQNGNSSQKRWQKRYKLKSSINKMAQAQRKLRNSRSFDFINRQQSYDSFQEIEKEMKMLHIQRSSLSIYKRKIEQLHDQVLDYKFQEQLTSKKLKQQKKKILKLTAILDFKSQQIDNLQQQNQSMRSQIKQLKLKLLESNIKNNFLEKDKKLLQNQVCFLQKQLQKAQTNTNIRKKEKRQNTKFSLLFQSIIQDLKSPLNRI